jgi:hypothetical protein
MASAVLVQQAQREDWSDEEIVRRVLDGETALYELLMRRQPAAIPDSPSHPA